MSCLRSACILIALLVSSALFSGCVNWVREWPPVDGVVLDAKTEQPIPGVVVEAVWEGGGHTTVCFHVENVYTDAQGQFRFPIWEVPDNRARISNQQRRIRQFHKAGYRKSDRTYKESSYKQGIYYLEKDTRSRAERLHDLGSKYLYLCNQEKQNQWPKFKSVFLELQSMGLRPDWIGEVITQRLWNMDLKGEAAYNYVDERIKEEAQ